MALVNDVYRFACCVCVVLFGEERQILEIVVGKTSVECNGAATPRDHVLVHPAILDAAVATSPDSKQWQRISATMANPAAEKDVLALEIYPDDIARRARQFVTNCGGKIEFDHLVSVEPLLVAIRA